MSDETPFVEANALLAIIRGETDQARTILLGSTVNELYSLAEHAGELSVLCWKIESEYRAAHGGCAHTSSCGQPAGGTFYYIRKRPVGVCVAHRADAEDDGRTLHEMPKVEL
jgi:hypothetical protein